MEDTSNRLRFVVVGRGAEAPRRPYPYVVLRNNDWDDYRFKTLFDVILRTGPNEDVSLGGVKILQRGQVDGRPALQSSFDELNADFCSLGQDIEYYEKLMRQREDLRRSYLRALRDAAADPKIELEFADEPGWERSLLRTGQATNALAAGRRLVFGETAKIDRLAFQFDWWYEGLLAQIQFSFDATTELPGRCHVLIGYNGVGKTTLLADLALTASSGRLERRGLASERASMLRGNDTTFGAVVTVSYSAFDTFRRPESARGRGDADGESLGYVYCGLRREIGSGHQNVTGDELKSIGEIESEFAEALDTAAGRESGGHLNTAFSALAREPSFGRIGIDIIGLVNGLSNARATEVIRDLNLSTGHKIVLNIVAQLAAHLRTRSLVLIDEPETHLHPPLVAALLGAIQVLLKAHRSFAVIATHSPVVVQEIPAQYVTILERKGTRVTSRRPEIETFGENIGAITRHVFSLDSSATDYQGILASLSAHYSFEQINDMFLFGLSVQARALVANFSVLP